MKRTKGDHVLTFKVNLSEVARTNQIEGQHPYMTAVQILAALLDEMLEEPSAVAKSVVWNGVDVGELREDW